MHVRFLSDVLDCLDEDEDLIALIRIVPYAAPAVSRLGPLQMPYGYDAKWSLAMLLHFWRALRLPASVTLCMPADSNALFTALLHAHIFAWAAAPHEHQKVVVITPFRAAIRLHPLEAFSPTLTSRAMPSGYALITDRITGYSYAIEYIAASDITPIRGYNAHVFFIENLEDIRQDAAKALIVKALRAGASVRAVWKSPDLRRSSCVDLAKDAWPFPAHK